MLRLHILAILLFACIGSGHLNRLIAQPLPMEMSEPLDIDLSVEDGWAKVLQLRNGNTALFYRLSDRRLGILLFNDTRKQVASTIVNGSLCSSKEIENMHIEGLYEIAGNPVLFLTNYEHGRVALYRLVFDGTIGTLTDEVRVVEASKNYFSMVGQKVDIVDRWDIAVEKDPYSDNYCVIVLDAQKASTKEKMRVLHFDGSHKIISDAKIGAPSDSYSFYNIIAATVDSNRRIFLAVYGADNSFGKDGHIHICRLNRGDTAFQFTQVDFSHDFKNANGSLQYNNRSNCVQLLANTLTSVRPGINGPIKFRYSSSMVYIDAASMRVKSIAPLTGGKIDSYLSDSLKIDKTFSGAPVYMILEQDNTSTVFNEDISQEIGQSSGSSYGDLGITKLSKDGVEEQAYVIRKYQYKRGSVSSFYPGEKDRGSWIGWYVMQLTFDYISSPRGMYLIMNDTRENFEKSASEKRKGVGGNTRGLQPIIYSMSDSGVGKSFLIDPPKEESKSRTCLISTSNYSKQSDTYAVLFHEDNIQDTKTKLLWISFGK